MRDDDVVRVHVTPTYNPMQCVTVNVEHGKVSDAVARAIHELYGNEDVYPLELVQEDGSIAIGRRNPRNRTYRVVAYAWIVLEHEGDAFSGYDPRWE